MADSDCGLQVLAALLNGVDPSLSEWDAIVEEANRQLIAPALYCCLRDRDALGILPDEVRRYLGFIHGLNEERNRRLRQQAVETVAALNAAQIEPLLIKGAALLMILPER